MSSDITRFFPRIDRIFPGEALNPFFGAQDEGFSEFRATAAPDAWRGAIRLPGGDGCNGVGAATTAPVTTAAATNTNTAAALRGADSGPPPPPASCA